MPNLEIILYHKYVQEKKTLYIWVCTIHGFRLLLGVLEHMPLGEGENSIFTERVQWRARGYCLSSTGQIHQFSKSGQNTFKDECG